MPPFGNPATGAPSPYGETTVHPFGLGPGQPRFFSEQEARDRVFREAEEARQRRETGRYEPVKSEEVPFEFRGLGPPKQFWRELNENLDAGGPGFTFEDWLTPGFDPEYKGPLPPPVPPPPPHFSLPPAFWEDLNRELEGGGDGFTFQEWLDAGGKVSMWTKIPDTSAVALAARSEYLQAVALERGRAARIGARFGAPPPLIFPVKSIDGTTRHF